MAWRMVKQPNGLLARFSDIVDDFTHLNMTENEAIQVCMTEHGMSEEAAKAKVRGGVEDWRPWTQGTPGTGHDRWDDAIETIKDIHGIATVQERLKAVGIEDNASANEHGATPNN